MRYFLITIGAPGILPHFVHALLTEYTVLAGLCQHTARELLALETQCSTPVPNILVGEGEEGREGGKESKRERSEKEEEMEEERESNSPLGWSFKTASLSPTGLACCSPPLFSPGHL